MQKGGLGSLPAAFPPASGAAAFRDFPAAASPDFPASAGRNKGFGPDHLTNETRRRIPRRRRETEEAEGRPLCP